MAWPDTTVGQFIHIQLQGSLRGGIQQWRNTFSAWGHDSASPVEVVDLTALLASAWMTDVVDAYLDILGTDATVDGVLARQVFDPLNPTDTKNEAFRTVALPGAHTAFTTAPMETCPLLHLGTDAAGRSAHGRMFVPWWFGAGDLAGEVFSSAVTTKTAAIATELAKLTYTSGSHAAGAAADFDLAVFSPTRRSRDEEQYGYRVVAISAPARVHFLRSRGPRG